MPVALFVSPHLDDAAFSCAEPILALGEAGWEVIVATVFTASVESPTGFALACQLDKGLAADIDYMALRRQEDRECMKRLGARWQHLDVREAPHRGYDSVVDLFGEVRKDDPAHDEVMMALRSLLHDYQPTVCLAPLAIGQHVDHRLMVDCLSDVIDTDDVSVTDASKPEAWSLARQPVLHYADQPYALKNPHERDAAVDSLEGAQCLRFSTLDDRRGRAIAALDAYTTQVPFQFGSIAAMQVTLNTAMADGTRFWQRGALDEALRVLLADAADRSGSNALPEQKTA